RSEISRSCVVPSMRRPAVACSETSTEAPEGLVTAAWTSPPSSSTAVSMRRMVVSLDRWLERGRIEDVERALESPAAEKVTGSSVVGEVVERVPGEGGLHDPVGSGEGGQLRRIDPGRKRAVPGNEHRPVVEAGPDAGGSVTGRVPRIDVEGAPGR